MLDNYFMAISDCDLNNPFRSLFFKHKMKNVETTIDLGCRTGRQKA